MTQVISKDSELDVSQEFIESGKPSQPHSKKRGGPYSKNERIKRQNEVHRLHFEYGYSAKRISEMMSINRNTINGDIDYLYSKIVSTSNDVDSKKYVIINIQRFNIQRSRLRESLDKSENFQQRLAIEKMIFDIDCKIINIQIKLTDSTKLMHKLGIDYVNKWLKDHGIDAQYMNYFDTIAVSAKASIKISKIIKEDRKKTMSYE